MSALGQKRTWRTQCLEKCDAAISQVRAEGSKWQINQQQPIEVGAVESCATPPQDQPLNFRCGRNCGAKAILGGSLT
jgi:hypothetical protein